MCKVVLMVNNMNNFHKNHYNHPSKPLIKCLTDCELGSEFTVVGVNAGQKAKKRLAHLGIFPGVKISMKHCAPFRGPINIIVKGTSIVLGRGLASRILVDSVNMHNQ